MQDNHAVYASGMAPTLAESIGGTVRQRAVRELRDRILTGSLTPGTMLDLDNICGEFGISRTRVREALLELSFQGLVEIAPRSAVTVTGVSPNATVDNFAILAVLSGKAAEWAATRVTPEQLEQLAWCVEQLNSAHAGHHLIDVNWQFHRIINQAASSQHLLALIQQAVRLIPSNFLAVMPVHDNSEHQELLDDLRKGRAKHACEVAEKHVLAAGQSLAGWLTERHATTATPTVR
jgi:DNA-binding GntR family transcriptional regulator